MALTEPGFHLETPPTQSREGVPLRVVEQMTHSQLLKTCYNIYATTGRSGDQEASSAPVIVLTAN